MRHIIISIFLIFSLCGCLVSQYNMQEGVANFKLQNYRHAFIRLLPEAERGNPDAQYAIGYMYYYGQGVIENRVKALYWIKCAADKGHKDAIAALKILVE